MSSFSVFHSTGDGGLSIPRIIINQLKWLDRVVDSKVIISAMTGQFLFLLICSVRPVIMCISLFLWPVICRNWPQSSWSWCQ